MEQDFRIEDLKSFLERGLGWGLSSLSPVRGHVTWSLNYKAVRATDDLPFLVKLTPDTGEEFQRRFDNLTKHLSVLSGSKAEQQLFPDGPSAYGHYRIRFLSWCPGVRIQPDRLSPAELAQFAEDYLQFSDAMSKTSVMLPEMDGASLVREVKAGCRGFWGRLIRRTIEREMPMADVVHRPELLRPIHGDFHYGNFHFENGRVSGFFDLEDIRKGYPTEDVVRYFVCTAEHLRWYALHRHVALLRAFRRMVGLLPYSAHEWKVAVNLYFLHKARRRVGRGWTKQASLWARNFFYRKLKDSAAC